jgi:hypothetical protein
MKLHNQFGDKILDYELNSLTIGVFIYFILF